MDVTDSTSKSEAGGPLLSIDDIKKGPLLAIPSEYGEAVAELEAQGFTRERGSESEGVVFLHPPGRAVAGYSVTAKTMTVVSQASPADHYPACSTGESKDLPPVNLSSGEIKEDVAPRKATPEKVAASVIVKPSIVQHDLHAILCITIDEFQFGSYDMTNTDEEKGHFIHSASIKVTPKWTGPQMAMDVSPATGTPQGIITTGTAGNVALTLAVDPSFTVGKEVSRQLEVSRVPYTLQRQELRAYDKPGMVGWTWQMRTWGDFQPFNPSNPQRFKQGSVPPLPYSVQDGAASFTAKVSKDGSRIKASWPVDKKLLAGVVGQFEMEVKVDLKMEIVYSKSFRLRIKNKFFPASQRPNPGYKDVAMTAKFAV